MTHYYYGQRAHKRRVLGLGYDAKVLSYVPIAYWPLYETSGTTAVCLVNSAQNGTYTGVTLGQTVTDANGVSFVCPLFDGINDFVNIWTTTFRDVFNGSEGTAMIWARVFNVGVWTDATYRRTLTLWVDGNNSVQMHRSTTNNRFTYRYEAGGTAEANNIDGMPSVDWLNVAMTWSATADQIVYYLDGAQVGAIDTGLGSWAGQLLNTATLIGASTTAPQLLWYGWLAHCAVWDTPLTGPQIADLAVS